MEISRKMHFEVPFLEFFEELYLCSKASCNQRPLGTTWIQEVHRKVDIVLVTSLRTGSGTARGEYAKSLLRQVQKVLKSTPEGDSVRVGIVRYGGRNILSQAHMHTFHG